MNEEFISKVKKSIASLLQVPVSNISIETSNPDALYVMFDNICQTEEKRVAFLEGMRSFRMSVVSNYTDPDLVGSFEKGRECSHILTGRRYED